MADTNDFDDLVKNFQEMHADEIKDLKPIGIEEDNEWFQAISNLKDIDREELIPILSIETKEKAELEEPQSNFFDDFSIEQAIANIGRIYNEDLESKDNPTDESIIQDISNFTTIKEEQYIDISQYEDYIWSDNTKVTEINFEELDEIENDLKSGRKTLDDFGTLFTIDTDEDGKIIYTSIRNAEFKPKKIYLDNQTKEQRIIPLKNGLKAYINKGEYLGDIIEILPYGLIDKKITGIGATSLELKAKRNSIILMPTKTLAYNKYKSLGNKDDVLLCIGSGYLDLVEPINELRIHNYIRRTDIADKKIIAVADSIDKVISAILKEDKNVFANYFLMVDEIDTLQSNNKLRKRISNVIDYYFKFKVQKRALISATINEFSHPFLKNEPLTIFDYKEPEKRDINLIYSKTISKTLAEKIISIVNNSPEKIVIAYNSISNILHTIKLLPKDLQDECGIMCSDMSKAEVEQYSNYASLKNDKLERQITFMTSSYFAGIDIKDKCHLISVSNVSKTFAILSLNTITQIHGRFRKGVISDSIIYNIFKIEEENVNKWLYRNANKYKENLLYKSQKVIELLKIMDTMILPENKYIYDIDSLSSLFFRIKHLIIENADEKIYGGEAYPLARINIRGKIETAYFNIDDLYNKMNTNVKVYVYKEALFNALAEIHNVQSEDVERLIPTDDFFDKKREATQLKKGFIEERLSNAQQTVINSYKDKKLNYKELDWFIKKAETQYEKEFYIRVKKHYLYIEINALTNNLLDISSGNKKNYRNLKNTFAFWLLEKKHPFKNQVQKSFKKGEKYSSQDIEEILSPIINYHFFKTISRSRLVNHFKSYFKCTYTGGKYLIKKDNPLGLPKPLKTISANKVNLKDYFEI